MDARFRARQAKCLYCTEKLAEYAPVSALVQQILGVPLQAHQPWFANTLNGLHKIIVIDGDHPEIAPQPLYGLAMNAIGTNNLLSHKLPKAAGQNQSNRLHGQQQRAVPGVYAQGSDVLAQRPTVKYIDELGTTANSEYRHTRQPGLLQQPVIRGIPFQVVAGGYLWLLPVTLRVNMSATGKYKPVQLRDVCPGAGFEMEGTGTL